MPVTTRHSGRVITGSVRTGRSSTTRSAGSPRPEPSARALLSALTENDTKARWAGPGLEEPGLRLVLLYPYVRELVITRPL